MPITLTETSRRLNKIAGQIRVSTDADQIREWAAECLANQLYEPGYVCQYVFAGEADITLMAYLSGIAWAMYHGNPARFGKPREYGSVWVHPLHRHKGIGWMIGAMVHGAYKATRGDDA